jgi:hypothetical protein
MSEDRQAELTLIVVSGILLWTLPGHTHILNHSDDGVFAGGFSLRANKY